MCAEPELKGRACHQAAKYSSLCSHSGVVVEQHRDLGVLAPLLGRLFGHELQGSEEGKPPGFAGFQLPSPGSFREPGLNLLCCGRNQTRPGEEDPGALGMAPWKHSCLQHRDRCAPSAKFRFWAQSVLLLLFYRVKVYVVPLYG